MDIGFLADDYHKAIVRKKDFLADLMEYTDIDPILIRRAIYYITTPPDELYLYDLPTPKIEELKEDNPSEYKNVVAARNALSTLLNNSIISDAEKDGLKLIMNRISRGYDFDRVDRKALLDRSRLERVPEKIEDFSAYNDAFPANQIDPSLKTDQQCEGKLVTMLVDYLEPRRKEVNDKKPTDHEHDHLQKDVMELIAEILNLRWKNKYDYKKVRTLYRNAKTVKI